MKRAAPLARKTPLRPKSKTARRKDSSRRCCRSYGSPPRRCTKDAPVIVGPFFADEPETLERYCLGHATQVADELVGDFVKRRDGFRCQLVGINGKPCSDERVWWCHLFRKGTYRSTRWTPGNAVAGCAAHHLFLDNHQAEWLAFCVERLGQEAFDGLLDYARSGNGPDAAYVIRAFRDAVRESEIAEATSMDDE